MRGRKVGSPIRQSIAEILYFIGKGYGYDIYKIYLEVFPKVTLRSIYYHLKKGEALGEFEVENVKKERGNYSWGEMAEKVYYKLGKEAKVKINMRVKKYLESRK